MKKLINPFQNILKLSVGDFFAKTLNFLAFLYLARVLGVTNYGVFEFGVAILTYFMLLADGGLEFWGTREAAQGRDIRNLAGNILPMRVMLAGLAFVILIVLLPLFPPYPGLRTILIFFGLTLFTYALNLKWAFMGQERLSSVALGLIVAQVVFAGLVFALVRTPQQVVLVPALWLAGDVAMALYFGWLFFRSYGSIPLQFNLREFPDILRPALTIGAAQAMGLISYNFDAILLGFLLGPNPVGLYRAAYKPITAALAMPLTYFLGLFPALSRTFTQNKTAFQEIVQRSLRLTAIFALPLGVGGTFLAAPLIQLLYGPDYAGAVPALQLLSWSACLIILRDTFRQGLIAARKQNLDLLSAASAVVFNVLFNFLLIPQFGIVGAAVATILSEIVWLSVSIWLFSRYVSRVYPWGYLRNPLIAAFAMGAWFYFSLTIFWFFQAAMGVLIYFGVLFILGEGEVITWLRAPGDLESLDA
jgi:O-antigen/teichoic acid export membrane protein